MSTVDQTHTERKTGAVLCASLGIVGALLAVINPFTGMIVGAAALVWSLIPTRSDWLGGGYRAATWVSTAALAINVLVMLLTLSSLVSGATPPVVVPVDPR